VEHGVKPAPARLTVAKHLEAWLEQHGPDLRQNTVKQYRSLIKVWIGPRLGRLRLSDLSDEVIERQLLRPMAEAGLARSTIERARAVLRSSFKRAQAARVAVQDAKVPKGARKATVTPALGKAEVDAIVAALAGSSLQPIVLTAAYLGLRNAEVRALQWRDIDFSSEAVHISAQLSAAGHRVPPKSDAGIRDIPLPSNVRQALEQLKKEQLSTGQASEWTFPSRAGTPLNGENLMHRFQETLKRRGIDPVPYHALRKARGVMLLEANQDIRIVSDILGHSDPSFTRRVYQGSTWELKRKAMEG
jgi:integrase